MNEKITFDVFFFRHDISMIPSTPCVRIAQFFSVNGAIHTDTTYLNAEKKNTALQLRDVVCRHLTARLSAALIQRPMSR